MKYTNQNMKKQEINTVNEYIAGFPENIQTILEQVRTVIKQAAPAATESISWEMPTYKLNGKPVVYFAGHKKHVGFYPTPSGIEAFKDELSEYGQIGKGSVRFSYDKPLPLDLIKRMVKYRATEVKNNSKYEKN
jgi:uncharacterized protein YdhG (YjbR/CyaY superfamily)